MTMLLRRAMMDNVRLGPNLLNPFTVNNWYLTQNRGTITIDNLGRMVFEVTDNTSSYYLYALMQNRSLTYEQMYGKKYRVIIKIDALSIISGDNGISASPDFTSIANPTRSGSRTCWPNFSSYSGYPIKAPGEYKFDFVCDIEEMSASSATFNTTDKLGASIFLNASIGSTAIISRYELHEIL